MKDAIPLTSAGYLKPSDVTAAAAVVPQVAEWMGKNNREANCPALLNFRESLQAMGLLRKLKGSLVLTKAGIAAQRDQAVLWRHLASRLIPSDGEAFECHATLLFLAQAGAAEDRGVRFKGIAEALTQLGWRREDGEPVPSDVLYRLNRARCAGQRLRSAAAARRPQLDQPSGCRIGKGGAAGRASYLRRKP